MSMNYVDNKCGDLLTDVRLAKASLASLTGQTNDKKLNRRIK